MLKYNNNQEELLNLQEVYNSIIKIININQYIIDKLINLSYVEIDNIKLQISISKNIEKLKQILKIII